MRQCCQKWSARAMVKDLTRLLTSVSAVLRPFCRLQTCSHSPNNLLNTLILRLSRQCLSNLANSFCRENLSSQILKAACSRDRSFFRASVSAKRSWCAKRSVQLAATDSSSCRTSSSFAAMWSIRKVTWKYTEANSSFIGSSNEPRCCVRRFRSCLSHCSGSESSSPVLKRKKARSSE